MIERARAARPTWAALALLVAALMFVAVGCGDDDTASGGGGDDAAAPDTVEEAASYGECEIYTERNSIELTDLEQPGELIVGYTSLAPATYNGDTEESVDDGFNYCFAANIANAAGLPDVVLKKVDFAQLIVARESGFDIAIDDFYIKPERVEKVDFSIPYGGSWSGIVVRSEDDLSEDEFVDTKMAVTLGSAQQVYFDEVLQPTEQYNTYDSPVEMFAALRANQVDAAVIDMPVALPAAAESNGAIETVAQIRAGGEVGIILDKNSPDTDPVSSVVQDMLDSGAIDEMEERYFFDAFGGVDPESLPQWGPGWDEGSSG